MNEQDSQTDLLIQFLDGELSAEQSESLNKAITENPALREELDRLRISRDAVKLYGIKSRIHHVHGEMMDELKGEQKKHSNIFSMQTVSRYAFRVAAVLIILFGISALYQYITVTPEKLFADHFKTFELRETRGEKNATLDELYKKGDMSELIIQFKKMPFPGIRDYFLVGNAYLSMHQPQEAIQAFTQLEQINRSNQTHGFEEDAEYYLALSYLANHEPAKALPIFDKIHSDPLHPYHEAVSAWFLRKLRKTAGSPN